MTEHNLPLDEAALSGAFADLNPISLVDQAREAIALCTTNARLNRRVQEMESAIRRVERIEQRIAEHAQGKPLGRIEAGFAVAAAETDAAALRARVAELEAQLATARAEERIRCLVAASDAVINEVVNESRHTAGERMGGRMSVIVVDKAIRARGSREGGASGD